MMLVASTPPFDYNSPKNVRDEVKVGKAWGPDSFHSHPLPLEASGVRTQPRAGLLRKCHEIAGA